MDANAPGVNNGASWTDAYNDLQDALSVAAAFPEVVEEIHVAQGVYRPAGHNGDRAATFQLTSDVAIKGGYAGFAGPEPNAQDVNSYETILSGDLNGNDGPDFTNNGENSYHVVSGGGTDTNATFDGFTITGGNAEDSSGGGFYKYSGEISNCIISGNIAFSGGGMCECNGVIRNCTVTANLASDNGGGMYSCDGKISNCVISGNSASYYGGGMYSCFAEIIDCIISNNSAGKWGGGMFECGDRRYGGGGKISNCTITGNSAENGGAMFWCNRLSNCLISSNSAVKCGGALYNDSSQTISNCIITNNLAEDGGAIYNTATSSKPNIINCTISYNTASSEGGGIHCRKGNPTVTNCILWGNSDGTGTGEAAQIHIYSGTPVLNYSCIQGWTGSLDEMGNIDDDPCFADPCNDDYHLQSQAGRWNPNSQSWVTDASTSPCIDAGNPGCPLGDEPNDTNNVRINMGAYGGTAEASKTPANWRSIADLTNDGAVDINDLGVFVKYWLDTGECIPSDLNRNQSVNFVDYAVFARQWPGAIAEPGIEYEISPCQMGLSAIEQLDETRFTVTVEGRYIHFEDMMVANCCPDELELQMTVEGNLIMIHEVAYLTIPCDCICNYPVTATLGPFEPGTYTLKVYNGGFIGSTTVTIE